MINILKTQNKIFIKLTLLSACVLLFSDVVIARNVRRAGSTKSASKKKIRSGDARKNLAPISSKNTMSATTTPTPSIDTSHITKYNCENLYNKCMNETCFNSKTGRCSCNTTSVFENANKKCEYITDTFPHLKDDIITSYRRIAKSDCTSYTMQTMGDENSSISNVLAELITCMQPKCRANRVNEFVGCFDKDNMEEKLKLCENVYSNVKDKDLLFKMFDESIITYKTKYCDENFGTMRDGECYIKIGLGTSIKDIKKVNEFKIGDTIICSENNFGVELGESKHAKIRKTRDIVVASIGAVGAIVDTASNIVSSKTDIIDKTSVSLIGSSGDRTFVQQQATGNLTSGNVVGNSILGVTGVISAVMPALPAIIEEDIDTSYTGYCYAIKGNQKVELFGATDDYSYQLRWAPDWAGRGTYIGEEEF